MKDELKEEEKIERKKTYRLECIVYLKSILTHDFFVVKTNIE
jgi:hypothetical protein